MTPPKTKPGTAESEESISASDAEHDTDVAASATDGPSAGVTRLRAGAVRRGPGAGLGKGMGARGALRREGDEGEELPRSGIGRAGAARGAGNGPGLGPRALRLRRAQEDEAAIQAQGAATDDLAEVEAEAADGNGLTAAAVVDATATAQILRSEIVAPSAPIARPAETAEDTRGRDFLNEDDDEELDDAGPAPRQKPNARNAKKPRRAMPQSSYVPISAVQPARMQTRHWGLLALFLLMVVIPTGVYGWYMYARAADQYESNVGFGSRTENAVSPFAFLGALGGMGGGNSGSDMDILAQFIYSQELVARIDRKLDLRTIFSKPQNDPLMAFSRDGTVEDLVDYWQSMVKANYDGSSGLMKLQVFAFDPKDAQAIAREILAESTSIINELSVTAQTDSTRYSKQALEKSKAELAAANKALTDFRIKNHIIDPGAQLQGASQVVNTLVQQMAAAQIDLDLLTGTVPATDPRLAQLTRRIEVIQNRIREEQSKVGSGLSNPDAPGYAALVVDYQNLQMQQDFASKAYVTALGAYDQAVNQAQQKTHYLATYLSPTLAESSTAPNRPLRIAMLALIGLLSWSAVTMIYYALRDRR